jgi:hypothetical protein
MDVHVSLFKVFGDLFGFRLRQFAAAHFLPEDVAHLGQQQLGSVSLEVWR